MEPVPVTRRVRRTVRLAVALVIGQALLCALIGWLTLGHDRSEPQRPGSPVDQLAAPPLVPAPPATVARSAAVVSKQSRRPSSAVADRPRATAVGTAAPRPTAATPTPTPTTNSAAAPTRSPVPIGSPPADPAPPPMVPPLPPTPSASASSKVPPQGDAELPEVQEPVEAGARCRPLYAFGRTEEGNLVRCLRKGPYRPRWKIV